MGAGGLVTISESSLGNTSLDSAGGPPACRGLRALFVRARGSADTGSGRRSHGPRSPTCAATKEPELRQRETCLPGSALLLPGLGARAPVRSNGTLALAFVVLLLASSYKWWIPVPVFLSNMTAKHRPQQGLVNALGVLCFRENTRIYSVYREYVRRLGGTAMLLPSNTKYRRSRTALRLEKVWAASSAWKSGKNGSV